MTMDTHLSRARRWLLAPRRLASPVLALLLTGCDPLPLLTPGTCGNGVVDDPTEDCDGVSAACNPPGTTGACRFACSSDLPCPGGFRCGADGLCRAPRGARFHTPTQLDPQLARDVRVADLDGDGLAETIPLRGDGLAILRLGPPAAIDGLAVQSASLLRGVRTAPDIADLTGDGLPDLVLADRGVVLARGGAVVTPVPSPSFSVSSPIFLVDAVAPGEAGVPAALGAGKELVTWKAGSFSARFGSQSLAVATFAPDPTTWQATALGNLRDGAGSPCEEIVIAHGSAQSALLTIVTPCALSGSDVVPNSASVVPSVDLTLSSPSTVLGLLLADVDRDGHLDIVAKGLENIYVAYGDGAGAFRSGPCGGGVPNQAGAVSSGVVSFNVLALADLDQDGRIDVVEQTVEGGVVRLSGAPLAPATCDAAPFADLGKPVAASSASGWQQVRIADFDGDGWLDVAAIPAVSGQLVDQGIDLFSGGAGGTFTYTRLDVGQAASRVELGDFDGNGLTDLAVVGLSGDASAPSAELHVLFGAPFAPPASLTSLGAVGEVLALASGGVQAAFATTLDKPDELVVLSKGPDGATLVALFAGAGSQQLFAPLLTPDPLDAESITLPMRGVVGAFAAGGVPGVAMVSRAANPAAAADHDRVWFADNDGDGILTVSPSSFSPVASGLGTTLSLAAPSANIPPFAPLDASVLVAADTDGDGLDEAFFFGFTAIASGATPAGVIASLARGAEPLSAASELVFFSVEEKDGKVTSFATPVLASLQSKAVAVDLDGDGDDEILALGVRFAEGPACFSAGVLAVLDGDGAGFVDVATAPIVEPPSEAGAFSETFTSFAIAELDGDPTPEIVVLARPVAGSCAEGFDAGRPARAYVIDVVPKPGPASGWTFTLSPLPGEQGDLELFASTLAAGDVNGDGLDDLVGGGPKGTFVALGLDRLGGGS